MPVADPSAAHPTNVRDGAALLSERFAARAETQAHGAPPEAPISGESVAARLIASWLAPVRAVEEDGADRSA